MVSLVQSLTAQNRSKEQVRRLQRTIFIYNIAQQVSWENANEFKSFKIGVLGPDRTTIDLQAMAQKRQILGKPVSVVRFDKVKEIRDVQLVYVNKKYNYDVQYILNSIASKNILLVSEDYNYHSSMINIVRTDDSFVYEINKDLLDQNNFNYKTSLGEFAINSASKWKTLYEDEQSKLLEEQNKVSDQSLVIENKELLLKEKEDLIDRNEKLIDESKGLLSQKQDSIFQLVVEKNLQQAKYEDKVLLEQELQKTIEQQVAFVKEQERVILNSNKLILEQHETLSQQDLEILKKQEVLDTKDRIISTQKLLNGLIIAFAGLLVIGGLLVYRSYLSKRKLSVALAEKNKAFEAQAKTLKAKNKELEQFAYIASHDLQEPLNTITSLIGLLREEYDGRFDDLGKQSLQYMEDSSTRMRALINALLKHSKLGAIGDKVLVDVNVLIDDIKSDLKEVFSKTEAKVIIGDMPSVMAAKVELGLAFQNLITNAIKFTAADVKPEIRIAASYDSDGAFWKFSVADNGIGIPEKYKERIFNIFQRLHNREAYEGTGIGLAHVKKVIDGHGGDIWVTSEEGKGSTFYFTIPD